MQTSTITPNEIILTCLESRINDFCLNSEMTTATSPSKTASNIGHVGPRPKNDKNNVYREKLSCLVRDIGCFQEICAEKLYLVNLAEGFDVLDLDARISANCPFNIWTQSDYPRLEYEPFNKDFGPFHLAMTHEFCSRLKIVFDTLHVRQQKGPVVIVLDDLETKNKLNFTLCVAIAAMVLLNMSDQEVIERLNFSMSHKSNVGNPKKELIYRRKKKFNDVSGLRSVMKLTIEDCIRAFYAAIQFKFYDYYTFDHAEYIFYETVVSGDLNWIVPGKLLAFAGPGSEDPTKYSPKHYYPYFTKHSVSDVVRLNTRPHYESSEFQQMGIKHHTLIFSDGHPPTMPIATQFIDIVDKATGAVAVHCRAGLGRTGTLIAVYLMARYKFTPEMAVAWTRICRPGSVIGSQQDWLVKTFDMSSIQQTPLKAKTKKAKGCTSTDQQVPKRMPTPEIEDTDEVDNIKTSYETALELYGQATALVMVKRQREARDKIATRNTLALIKKKLAESDERMSSKKVQQNDNAQVLDLGKTLPMMLHLHDFKDGNPSTYRFQDGEDEWRIKFPESDVNLDYEAVSTYTPASPDSKDIYMIPRYFFGYEMNNCSVTFPDGSNEPKLIPVVKVAPLQMERRVSNPRSPNLSGKDKKA